MRTTALLIDDQVSSRSERKLAHEIDIPAHSNIDPVEEATTLRPSAKT